MDDTDEDDDSEIDLLLWMSTPTSSDRSSRRRLRYLSLNITLVCEGYMVALRYGILFCQMSEEILLSAFKL